MLLSRRGRRGPVLYGAAPRYMLYIVLILERAMHAQAGIAK